MYELLNKKGSIISVVGKSTNEIIGSFSKFFTQKKPHMTHNEKRKQSH